MNFTLRLLFACCATALLAPAAEEASTTPPTDTATEATAEGAAQKTIAQVDPSEALARELLAASGAADLGIQVMDQMIAQFKRQQPNVPNSFWTNFQASCNPDSLTDLIVPIYTRNLSDEEMQAAIDFYRSPAGQTLVDKLPQITKESMEAGSKWGRDIAHRVITDLQNLPAAPTTPATP